MTHRDPYVRYIDTDLDICVAAARSALEYYRSTNLTRIPAKKLRDTVRAARQSAGLHPVSDSTLALTLTVLRLAGEIKPVGVREDAKQVAWGNTTVEIRRAVSAEGEAVATGPQGLGYDDGFRDGRRATIRDIIAELPKFE